MTEKPGPYIDHCPICGDKVRSYQGEVTCPRCVVILRYPKFSIFGNKLYIAKKRERNPILTPFLLLVLVSGIPLSLLFNRHENLIWGISCLSGSIVFFLYGYWGFRERLVRSRWGYVTERNDPLLFNGLILFHTLVATGLFLYGSLKLYYVIYNLYIAWAGAPSLELLNE